MAATESPLVVALFSLLIKTAAAPQLPKSIV